MADAGRRDDRVQREEGAASILRGRRRRVVGRWRRGSDLRAVPDLHGGAGRLRRHGLARLLTRLPPQLHPRVV